MTVDASAPASPAPGGAMSLAEVHAAARRLLDNVARIMVGKERVTEALLVALLCEGHVLLEDVPGLGKTTLAKAVAQSLGCSFHRIQFTPDLMPADLTGITFYNQRSGEFEFRPGPLLAQLVLADEINRASPRTQSALLEAMDERQITVEGRAVLMERPFLVIATQNPVELEGTFPLPEAQLDRFLLRLPLGYPTEDEEAAILERFARRRPENAITSVLSAADLDRAIRAVEGVHLSAAVRRYLLALVRATRDLDTLDLGASPRASLGLMRTARALAAIRGRDYVLPDDVQEMAPLVVPHRLVVSSQARLRSDTAEDLFRRVLERIPVPVQD